mgnify:CR=1 FL=1
MKFSIDNSALAEDFFSDTKVLGIVAPVKDYRFCWLLNQALGCDFRLNSDIEIQLAKKGRQYFFSIYEYLLLTKLAIQKKPIFDRVQSGK